MNDTEAIERAAEATEEAEDKAVAVARYKVPELPAGRFGKFRIERKHLGPKELGMFMGVSLQEWLDGRGIPEGEYTILYDESGHPWMGDTPSELDDLMPIAHQHGEHHTDSILITGLGMGCSIKMAVLNGYRRIDVVETDEDLLEIGMFWKEYYADEPVLIHVHHGDAFTWEPPEGAHWDYAWHDIWPHISPDNLPEMETLEARYARHTNAQGFWQRDGCELLGNVEQLYGGFE